MHYRSVADLNDTIMQNFHRLPRDIDLVVGIPRSGMLAATMISLVANIPMTDLDRFIEGKTLTSGVTKRWAGLDKDASQVRRVLVVDDSIDTGRAMQTARERIAAAGIANVSVMFAAIYGLTENQAGVDFTFETVPQPRIFQWNILHHGMLEKACVDIDGVLCLDPTAEQNDDGVAYQKFLSEAVPLLRITRKIGYLVTSRLEKYRSHTVEWLARTGIQYNQLIMLDLPSAEERRRLGAHGGFKADFYKTSDTILFIESEKEQARAIARISGKPVFCVETQHMLQPDTLSLAYLGQNVRTVSRKFQSLQGQHGFTGALEKVAKRALKLGSR